MTGSGGEAGLSSECGLGLKIASMHVSTHLVIHNFLSQAGRHHLLQRLLFALCLSCQLCRAVTKPSYVILQQHQSRNKCKTFTTLMSDAGQKWAVSLIV